MSDHEQTISIPSLLLVAALTALAVRYFFFNNASAPTPRPNPRAANPAHIEQVASMFPQIGRREIIWDLQRNGGSVAATTERILSTGSLDRPPPSFQPPIPTSTTPNTASSTPQQNKPEHVNLITRYKLASKIASQSSSSPPPSSDGSASSSSQSQTWSNNKIERQALLQRRREEMILNARRRLEEKDRESQGQRA